MLDDAARVAIYQAQNGYSKTGRLTPRQQRRIAKKRRAQSWDAAERRADRAAKRKPSTVATSP